ncbi:MAG: FTR1 family protein, partial [Candidatus Burarchaeum sp.]
MALAEFIVTFREFFEIALIIGIMQACLYKTGNSRFGSYVYLGVAAAAIASIAAAFAFGTVAGGFEANEELFEGVTLIIASALVTWMIIWMMGQRNVGEAVRSGLSAELGR